ncbi:HNH endonuclease signature motif containing protein [Sulfuricurvum sp.]|uniref:HNH endonuclease signature motif containing protein n=1 Tax=Sulfuricurvum sp. TaxID=2025608 RepID=UPI00356ABCE5
MTHKVWMPVYNFKNIYEVSSEGEIRRIKTGKILSPRISTVPKKGKKVYASVALYKWINGELKRHPLLIHTIVARAFIGKKPIGFQVNHKDGVKLNNYASNLEYVTQKENMRHARELGLIKPHIGVMGSKSNLSKLTDKDVLKIRKERACGAKIAFLAEKYDVCFANTMLIVHRKTWRHI